MKLPMIMYAVLFLVGAVLMLTSNIQFAVGAVLATVSYFELRKEAILPKDILNWIKDAFDKEE